MLFDRLFANLFLHLAGNIFKIVGPHVSLLFALADRVEQRRRHLPDRLPERQIIAAAQLGRRLVNRRVEQMMPGNPAELRLRRDRVERPRLFRGEKCEKIFRKFLRHIEHRKCKRSTVKRHDITFPYEVLMNSDR